MQKETVELFESLATGDDAAQIEASKSLREIVECEHRLHSTEGFSKFMNELYKRIFILISAEDTRLTRGGIYAIHELINASHDENESQIIRFANYLRIVFQQPEDRVDDFTLTLASEALGMLSRSANGALISEFVEFEAKRAFEWLFAAAQADSVSSNFLASSALPRPMLMRRKLAAVLVLKELASNSPVLFFSHVSMVFDHIQTALFDSNVFTREAATLTLRACLELILLRETRLCVQWYYTVYEIAHQGFAHKGGATAATIHGALLTLGELLRGGNCFMIPRFTECCDTIFKYKDYKNDLIRRTVLSLLPELAQFSPDAFVRRYLDVCIECLFEAVKRPTERDTAFRALGRLAIAVSHHILPHLPEIMLRVREGLCVEVSSSSTGLSNSSSGGHKYCEAPLVCISMLAQAVGPALLEHNMSSGLLGEMFRNGLSVPLINAVSDIKTYIPSLSELVMAHLLHSLSLTLANRPFFAPPGGGIWGETKSFSHLDMLQALVTSQQPQKSVTKTTWSLCHSITAQDPLLDNLDWRTIVCNKSVYSCSYIPGIPSSNGENRSHHPISPGKSGVHSYGTGTNAITRRNGALGGTKRKAKQRDYIILALRTLREFKFENVNLLPFVSKTVISYMDDIDPAIRKEVAMTCGTLLLPKTYDVETKNLLANWDETARLTSNGVRSILMLGVSDPEPSIRSAVLESLQQNERYDDYLMQEDTLSALFVALQDEDFEVRRIAVSVASRLAPRNPAHIHPAIRKCILTAMAQLEFSPGQDNREEGAVILLGDIVVGFNKISPGASSYSNRVPPLIAPFIVSLIRILIAKLRDARNTMATAILRTLGEIASMEGVNMSDYMDKLMPLIIDILQDQGSPGKRRWALWTLGQFVRSTGLVIFPLLNYPGLLYTLLGVINGGSASPWDLREEALRTLGALGALDPFETKAHSTFAATRSSKQDDGVLLEDTIKHRSADDDDDPLSPSEEEYYPTVAVGALMRIIKDSTLSTHHSMVVQALTHIFRSLGLSCVPFLPQVMPCILSVATQCEQELRKVLFHNISVVVSISKQHIRPYLDDIFHLIHSYWYENLDQVFVLIEELSRALREEFVPYVRLVIPNILAVLELMRDDGQSKDILTPVSQTASKKYLKPTRDTRRYTGDGKVQYSSPVGGGGASYISNSSSASSSMISGTLNGAPSSSHVSQNRKPSLKNLSPVPPTSIHDVSTTGGRAVIPSNSNGAAQLNGAPTVAAVPSELDGSRIEKARYSKYATASSARRVFKTIGVLSFTLTDYFYVVVPALIDLVESENASPKVRMHSMRCLAHLSSHANFSGCALNAMQCILRFLRKQGADTNMKCQALDTLCVFALRFPSVFSMFRQTVDTCVKSQKMAGLERYRTTLECISLVKSDPNTVAKQIELLLSSDYTKTTLVPGGGPWMIEPLSSSKSAVNSNSAGDLDLGSGQKKLQVNQAKLKKAWEASERSTSEEWIEWTRRLSVELLRESPSPALRACSALAQVYNPLAKGLFNAAFVSCWSALFQQNQFNLIYSLEIALRSAKTPPETLQTLLHLAEFMEHDDRVLPIGIRDLGDYAQRCHAYAKALHYKEMVFRNLPGACTEALISINNKLEQPEAAVGILHYVQHLQRRQYQLASSAPASKTIPEVNMLDFGVAAASLSQQQQIFHSYSSSFQRSTSETSLPKQQNNSLDEDRTSETPPPPDTIEDEMIEDGAIKLKETWFEKLGRWEEALTSYNEKLENVPEDTILTGKNLDNAMGKVRCLINLGEYDQLSEVANNVWPRVTSPDELEQMAPIFCESAWVCGDWEAMENFSRYIPEHNLNGYMLRAVLALQREDFQLSRLMINRGRELLGEHLGALVGESYNRAYRQIVTVQQFAELDEIYQYKEQVASGKFSAQELENIKLKLQRMWARRIRGCQENVAVWQNILGAHSLILSATEDMHTFIKFSTICRKSGRLRICLSTLQRLGVTDDTFTEFNRVDPNVSFAFIKYRWAMINKPSTLKFIVMQELFTENQCAIWKTEI
uniref:Serine/threonine-protein kinase TOR n=2 Tax=Mucochytrium quahogii TaxID=96639 RepID=A0A7S2SE74_9STRA|mmetsp:Transcript_36380/g.58358  ORF Transcript_36380/g.58358 Transcript_36380/m.58358 type:complete len:2021 (-) Transcript_36380:182-6244(-)